GSVTAGGTKIDNTGLTFVDASGAPIANTTQVGANVITVASNPTTGPANTIRIDGDTGTIGGLSNRTFDPNNIVNGQAATEDQLKLISDVANTGWNIRSDSTLATTQVKPGDTVDIGLTTGEANLTRTAVTNAGTGVTTIAFGLSDNIDLGAAGSVTAGGTKI